MNNREKRIRQQRYMVDVAERIDKVLEMTGHVPGALAKLFCYNFVGWAKRQGASKAEATRLMHQTWERFEKQEALDTISAEVKT